MAVDIEKKYERDYAYQKKYLKRITVWFNTKNDSDMNLMDFLVNFRDGAKSDNIKQCIYECMKAHEANHTWTPSDDKEKGIPEAN